MWLLKAFFFVGMASVSFNLGYGCEMDGVGQWVLPQTLEIVDTDRGIVFTRGTNNIEGISSVTHFDGLNSGPYMDVSYADSNFVISTSAAYDSYEENETLQSFSITVVFSCTGGSTNILVFIVNIRDTNNNAPQFRPSDEYEFTIAPPVPPGFQITGCVNDIIVRDIDLTTQRIEFGIEENPYFEVTYDETTTEPKEFKAILRTTTLIRNLPEAVELRITATDVDLTGDPPITTTAVIRIQGDSDFQLPEEPIFARPFYLANYTDADQLVLSEPISLQQGYDAQVQFTLEGELQEYFRLVIDGNSLNIETLNPLTTQTLETQPILLVVRAERQDTSGATTSVVISTPKVDVLRFEQSYYEGQIVENDLQISTLFIIEGYEAGFSITIDSEFSSFFNFQVQGNAVTLTMTPLDENIINENSYITLEVGASSGLSSATTIVIIEIIKEDNITPVFEKAHYIGSYEPDSGLVLETILLTQGYDETVIFGLNGDYAEYFGVTNDENQVAISLTTLLPENVISENNFVALHLTASGFHAVVASTTIIIDIVQSEKIAPLFSEAYYSGVYTVETGLQLEESIFISQGFDASVTFGIEDDFVTWFSITHDEEYVTLLLDDGLPEDVWQSNDRLIFTIVAYKPDTVNGRAVIFIELPKGIQQPVIIRFTQSSFQGIIENGELQSPVITLEEEIQLQPILNLSGDYASLFQLTRESNNITLELLSPLPEEVINDNTLIVLDIEATSPEAVGGNTAVVFEIIKGLSVALPVFEQPYYIGEYTNQDGLLFENTIRLIEGFDESVTFDIEGDDAQWFEIVFNGENELSLNLLAEIPVLSRNYLVFSVVATKSETVAGRSTILISLTEIQIEIIERFDKTIYEGIVQDDVVEHEAITLSGYNGSEVELIGEHAIFFTVVISQGIVTVARNTAMSLPANLNYVLLELRISSSSAVLILDIVNSDNPEPSPPPVTVTFSSSSYEVNVDVSQTGLVGRVEATADNAESLQYSLLLDNDHLQQRLSIDSEGGLFLSAPANSGQYTFQVVAITTITQASATADVNLSVGAIVACTDDDLVLPPLIILDRDEEEAHENLVVLDAIRFEGCQYTLENRWPTNQTWLYVDENGLHSTAIDREHESIAFMALSQVQVQLILECDSDNAVTRLRSTRNAIWPENLGPYDYGNSKWILTEAIPYNPRHSLVNLIVNDINDNYPIFAEKENEPIAVGYPISELEERILPRALIELKATDADVGENAAIRYWSSEDMLTVSPLTGFVHVRDNENLLNDAMVTVYATDRNGEGLTTSLNLMIKLIDANHIAVVTVRDAFLDDEETVLDEISTAVGYDVKALSAVVVSHGSESEASEVRLRKNRDLSSDAGSALQLYVYGLIDREPVDVGRLASDITNNAITAINIARSVSLEDHLDSLQICNVPGRDTALLVATIVLSVLSFILIVAVAVWTFLRWKKKQNYDQFSDENSIASRNESPVPKPENIPKPRLNIEELIKSDRRLKEMLNVPIVEEVAAPTTTANFTTEPETKVAITELQVPVFIQSIDKLKDADLSEDEDEFGERLKSKRKSVVTFNENVEKIIHLEDTQDELSNADFEVYKF